MIVHRNYGLRRRVIEEIAPDLSAAVGPVALAELASAVLFIAMLAVWFVVLS